MEEKQRKKGLKERGLKECGEREKKKKKKKNQKEQQEVYSCSPSLSLQTLKCSLYLLGVTEEKNFVVSASESFVLLYESTILSFLL